MTSAYIAVGAVSVAVILNGFWMMIGTYSWWRFRHMLLVKRSDEVELTSFALFGYRLIGLLSVLFGLFLPIWVFVLIVPADR